MQLAFSVSQDSVKRRQKSSEDAERQPAVPGLVMVRSLWGVVLCVAMCAEALHTPWSMPSQSKPRTTPMLRRTATMQLKDEDQTVTVTGKEVTLKLVVQDEEKSVPIAAAAVFAISSSF